MKELKLRKSVPVDEIGTYMKRWHDKKPQSVDIDVIGKSGGYNIYSAVFTDKTVSDEDKQRVLIVAQHSGMEITGMTTALSLGNYLASDNENADEMLKKLVVVVVPCPNPFSFSKQSPDYQFRNEAGIDEYIAFGYDGARADGAAPSAQAIQSIIDKYKPELLLDLHGVWGEKQLVIESCGYSAFASNMFYNSAMTEALQQASVEAGFAPFYSDFMETLIQADKSCDDKDINSHFRGSANGAIAPTYAYLKYHTLAASLEIAWEKSGLAKVLKALKMGCEVNKFEYYSGYQVRTAVSPYGHNSIRAWGTNACQRRASRIELWEKRGKILIGAGHPERPGLSTVIVSCSPETARSVIGEYYRPMDEVCAAMKSVEGADVNEMLEELQTSAQSFAMASIENGEEVVIENGMTLRFAIPFSDAEIEKVTYNGIERNIDEADGYIVVREDNWVFVDLNIPPDKVAPFAVGMVKYKCTVPETGIVDFD